MRILVFGRRTAREILRDPMSLGFGLGFPVALLLLMTVIQRNIPVSLFELDSLTPGVTCFGLSFLCLFAATLVAKDRSGSLLLRLQATPMTGADFFLGYLLPLLPIALGQMAVSYGTALVLGLSWTPRILLAIVVQLPMAVCFLSLGLVCGCLLTERQASSLCGALLTNLSAWLSGAWFDLSLVGGVFETVAFLLPFANATEAGRMALSGNKADIARPLTITAVYSAVSLLAALLASRRLSRRS